jgi:hypothetical protein
MNTSPVGFTKILEFRTVLGGLWGFLMEKSGKLFSAVGDKSHLAHL